MAAATVGSQACVSILLERQAGIVAQNNWNALMFAVINGQKEAAKLLLASEKEVKSFPGTQLMLAVIRGDAADVDKHMDETGREVFGYTALMFAAILGYEELVRKLVDCEAGIKGPRGQTALQFAAKSAQIGCV